jgi:hypothetical protein
MDGKSFTTTMSFTICNNIYSRCFCTKEGDLRAFFSGVAARLGPEI